jgi:hypothetical protein
VRRGFTAVRAPGAAADCDRRGEHRHGKAARVDDRRSRGHYVTVTRTAVDVCVFPATSVAIAVRVCPPLATFFVFQLTE